VAMVERPGPLSLSRQCELLGLNRVALYYQPVEVDAYELELMAPVMDWVSRYVLAWRLSNLLDASFCIEALQEALRQGRPEIFNTDQGSQFTDDGFTGVLRGHGVAISMDGRGRFADNIFVERLWRSVKYEEVYLKAYESVAQARRSIDAYFEFYNRQRLHQALGYRTPRQVLEQGLAMSRTVADNQ
jgi:putative transposase